MNKEKSEPVGAEDIPYIHPENESRIPELKSETGIFFRFDITSEFRFD